jgi:hypothetical protein
MILQMIEMILMSVLRFEEQTNQLVMPVLFLQNNYTYTQDLEIYTCFDGTPM